MTFRLAHANVCEPASPLDTARTINTVTAHADVVTFNEANDPDTHSVIAHLPGWDSYLPTHGPAREDCIAWRRDHFAFVIGGNQTVMPGGRVAGRRRGPSRAVAWVVLEEKATGLDVVVATHHDIARADTPGYRWRRPLRAGGWRAAAKALQRVLHAHPAPLILAGDLNTIGRVTFAGLDVREVKSPPTYGRRRYDRILTSSGVYVRGLRALRTKSDHLALTALVTLEETP